MEKFHLFKMKPKGEPAEWTVWSNLVQPSDLT